MTSLKNTEINESKKELDYGAGDYFTSVEGVTGWIEETNELRWAELEKLPYNLGEKILEDFISDYLWIKGRELTREEAIAKIEIKPIEAECCVYGIHGQKASLSFNNPECLFWNIFDLKYFESIFRRETLES